MHDVVILEVTWVLLCTTYLEVVPLLVVVVTRYCTTRNFIVNLNTHPTALFAHAGVETTLISGKRVIDLDDLNTVHRYLVHHPCLVLEHSTAGGPCRNSIAAADDGRARALSAPRRAALPEARAELLHDDERDDHARPDSRVRGDETLPERQQAFILDGAAHALNQA